VLGNGATRKTEQSVEHERKMFAESNV